MVGGILYWRSRRLSPTKDTSTASEVDRKSAPEQSNGLVETDADLQEHEHGCETNKEEGTSTAADIEEESAA